MSLPTTKSEHICQCGYKATCLYKLTRHQNGPNCGSSPTTRFIEQSKSQYPEAFTYENCNYFKGKATGIRCVLHGEFSTRNHFTQKFGACPGCSPKPTFEAFCKRAEEIHGDFVYDKASFINMSADVRMTHTCGRVLCMSAEAHVKGTGCIECWKNPTPLEPIIDDLTPYRGKILPHPIHSDYGWDVDKDRPVVIKSGAVLNKKRARKGWYAYFKMYAGNKERAKSTTEHIFKYECFHRVDATGTQIDHKNDDHTDDHISNLQRLTIRDHARKTSAVHNGETARKIAKTQGAAGFAFNPITKVTVEFDSINDLASKIHNSSGNIHRYIRTGKFPPSGFAEISFYKQDVMDGEEFKRHPVYDFDVSTFGRIRNRRRYTYGSPTADGYRIYNSKRIHILVAETFIGPAPSDKHTVHHKDKKRSNNRLDNLVWATDEEQAFDKTNTTRHTQINGFTGEKMAEFENTTHMLTALGVDHDTAHRVSGRRVWFTYVSKDDLHRKRLRFVNRRLLNTRGFIYGSTWKAPASGFFRNNEQVVRKMSLHYNSKEDKACFHKQNLASNCIKFYMMSFARFRLM